jgi:hypothetical protein
MQTGELFALGLAAAALWRAWREGAVFERWREHALAWSELRGAKRPLGLLGELLGCATCAAFWLAGGLAALLHGARLASPAAGQLASIVLWALAAAGVAQLVWDLHNFLVRDDHERPEA